MDKSQIRKQITNLLRGLSNTMKSAQSEIIFRKLINHPQYKNAKRISIYLSTENEVDTRPILRYSLEAAGKQCFIPFVFKQRKTKTTTPTSMANQSPATVAIGHRGDLVSPDDDVHVDRTRMVMVELLSMREYDALPVNQYGIKEPKEVNDVGSSLAKPNDDKSDLDVVIVPGVAFSLDGKRLGHGKGYYDEFLSFWSRKRSKGCPYTIGLAFREQLVDDPLAVEGHDYTLDEVLTSSIP